jgi:broad specificity phosphatase PhoE
MIRHEVEVFAVRHGIPEHIHYANDPGLDLSDDNRQLLDRAAEKIAGKLSMGKQLQPFSSTTQRAKQTAEALADHPLLLDRIISAPRATNLLAEESIPNPATYGEAWIWLMSLKDLAVQVQEVRSPCVPMLWVTHDSVLRALASYVPTLKLGKTDPLNVHHFQF